MSIIHVYESNVCFSWKFTMLSLYNEIKKHNSNVVLEPENNKYISDLSDMVISFTWPLDIPTIPGNNKFIIFVWETTSISPQWINIINNSPCKLLVPSNFSLNILKNNGVIEDRLIYFPFGVDTSVFYKDRNKKIKFSNKKFIFGNVSSNHSRKGIIELVKSYLSEFSSKDDTCLVIKTSGKKDNHNSINVMKEIFYLKSKYINPPEIKIITKNIDMIQDFYNSIDVFVSATKTEGFFYPALEAMACEVPIICTGYGGQMDFLNSENSYLIDYTIRDANYDEQYGEYIANSRLAEPNQEHLSYLMRYVYENYSDTINKVEKGKENIERFSWSNTIKILGL